MAGWAGKQDFNGKRSDARPGIDAPAGKYYFVENVLLERIMTTTITVKGQVTLPKKVRDAVGLKPGDKVEVRATASGGIYIEKPGASRSYREQLEVLAKRRLIKGMTTDEFMEFSRGESAEYRPKAK
jgi:antitoxin PrlF